ncbi:MAG TPA: YHS domain-containing protein [Thiohalobacter sp.]|nr:YHS domain-containing protein [Thiohalobacter sp.]
MQHAEDQIRDVVCSMWVSTASYPLEYRGMHFAFCSEECRERFLGNPGLYIGRPGEPAAKQSGEVWRKSRRIHLGRPLDQHQAEQVMNRLDALMSVTAIWPGADMLEVSYDLMQITARQIEGALEAAGADLGGGWSDRLKRSFIHLLEETESASREVRSTADAGHSGHGGH